MSQVSLATGSAMSLATRPLSRGLRCTLDFGVWASKVAVGQHDMATSLSHKADLKLHLGSLLLLESPKLTFRAHDSSLIFAEISKI